MLGEFLQGANQTVGRFVEDKGAGFGCQFGEACFPPLFRGKEALEGEAVARQPGVYQGGNQGGGAGEAFYLDSGFDAGSDQQKSGVGDCGCAGIRNQRHLFARLKSRYHSLHRLVLVEFVVSHKPVLNFEMF